MKRLVLILSILLTNIHFLFCLDETILIGKEDNWQNLAYQENIRLVQGKRGYLDIELEDGQYTATADTDLLLHLNHHPIEESTGNYYPASSKALITAKKRMFGDGAGLFRNWYGGLELLPQSGSLFFPGSEWRDFTIEFWVYPSTVENGEQILFWRGRRRSGAEIIDQELSCFFEDRRVKWRFTNIFVPPVDRPFSLSFSSESTLVPERWSHHTVRFDSDTGLLEYYINDIPEAILYATESSEEEETVFTPKIGGLSYSPLQIGNFFTGFIDEFRISKTFISDSFTSVYGDTYGTAIVRPIDFTYSNSTLRRIDIEAEEPGNSAAFYFYNISDSYTPLGPDSPQWNPFPADANFNDTEKGRYLQILLRLYPDGKGMHTPGISTIQVTYEPDLPPPPPSLLTADPGDRHVTLSWRPVAEEDVAGYLVYYGTKPGRYFGTAIESDPSPIDIGNKTQITIGGLTNGTLYFFAVVTYDSSKPPHVSIFSKEIDARPSSLLIGSNKK